ncbi:glucose 1-dehydrogenase [Candidatus Aerophobetes bacterium]|uniref:Glucose 1-dehydrogenase n=1 Tax=Aerophobetes bacterium TaxID=2030807 RepID=A0A523QKI5_UNCAE|nr:MAG: glucose 1-dehydrogenase [Candidatus Aerophobetes bacterium]
MRLKNKVAIVTGAARGIGKAIAQRFLQEGAAVAINDIDLERAEEIVHEAKSKGKKALSVKADVSNEKEVEEMVNRVYSNFARIDILVNNAGIIKRGSTEDHSYEDWDRVIAVNLRGTYNCSKAVIPIMKKQKCGKIVNVSSIAGKVGDIASAPSYGSSKGAINALTKSMARELAEYGICVNAVAPHAVETEMSAEWSQEKRIQLMSQIPLKRLGRPEEVAAAVLFLASDEASFITGEILDVNGGYLMD